MHSGWSLGVGWADRANRVGQPSRDVKFEPTVTVPVPKSGPAGLFAGCNVRLLGSCWAQHERPNAEEIYLLPGSMPDPEINAELDAGRVQKMCGAGSVLGPDFGENLTSLQPGAGHFIGRGRTGQGGVGFNHWDMVNSHDPVEAG